MGGESGWILHAGLGWLYPSPSDNGGIWLWKENVGWLWTDGDKFPYLYSETKGSWMYYYGTVQQRDYFLTMETGSGSPSMNQPPMKRRAADEPILQTRNFYENIRTYMHDRNGYPQCPAVRKWNLIIAKIEGQVKFYQPDGF